MRANPHPSEEQQYGNQWGAFIACFGRLTTLIERWLQSATIQPTVKEDTTAKVSVYSSLDEETPSCCWQNCASTLVDFYDDFSNCLYTAYRQLGVTHPHSWENLKFAANILFTIGACLTLTLLTFSGGLEMGTTWFAASSTALAVSYEGQIYWDNTRRSLEKNFERDAVDDILTKVAKQCFKKIEVARQQVRQHEAFISTLESRVEPTTIQMLAEYLKLQAELDKLNAIEESSLTEAERLKKIILAGKINSPRTKNPNNFTHNDKDEIIRRLKELNTLAAEIEEGEKATPTFIAAYHQQKQRVAQLAHYDYPNEEQKQELAKEKYRLEAMLRLMANTLNTTTQDKNKNTKLKELLNIGGPDEIDVTDLSESINTQFKQKQTNQSWLYFAGIFSLLSGGALTLGSISLIFEALSAIGLAGSLPFGGVLILALLAGITYAFMVYNSFTDLITHSLFSKLFEIPLLEEGEPWYKYYLILAFKLLFFTMAVALTIFTAGTWVTILKQTNGLRGFLKLIPLWLRAWVMPLLIAIGEGIFAVENIDETIEQVVGQSVWQNIDAQAWLTGVYESSLASMSSGANQLKEYIRNPYFINPLAVFAYSLESTLVVIGFMLHVLSIGLRADRVPGVPALVCVLMSALSEVGEDYHYFFGDDDSSQCCNHHNHNETLPVWMIRLAIAPIKLAAIALDALWRYCNASAQDPHLQQRIINIFSAKPMDSGIAPEETSSTYHHTIQGDCKRHNDALETQLVISELKDTAANSATSEKALVFQELATKFTTGLNSPTSTKTILDSTNGEVVDKHRFGLFRHCTDGKTGSRHRLERIKSAFFPQKPGKDPNTAVGRFASLSCECSQ